MIVTFDTNILVYAADTRNPAKQARALELLRQPAEAVLLWQVACEFIAASRRLTPSGLTPTEAWDQLSHYLAAFPLVLPASELLIRARELHVAQQKSFWDAMILAACDAAGVQRLYTEDLPGSTVGVGLEIVNPFLS